MVRSGIPKYIEVKEDLEERMLRGEFPPGSTLPSEPDLAVQYRVSRGTIRQALGALERDGIIARRPGIGTIVVRKPKQPSISSFTDQVVGMGKNPSTKIIRISQIPATQARGRVYEAFLQGSRDPDRIFVFCIERLRLADDHPVLKQTIYLKQTDFNSDFLESEDFTRSVFGIYARYHRRLTSADEIIQARLATPEEIEVLGMAELPKLKQMVYIRERISYDQENIPVEVLTSIERGDFFRAYRYRIVEEHVPT